MTLTSKQPKRRCDCVLCKRWRRFERITRKLPEAEREWIVGFYNYVVDVEMELEMRNAHRN